MPNVDFLSRAFARLGTTRNERAIASALIVLLALAPFVTVFAHRGLAPLALALGIAAAMRPEIWRRGVPRFLTRPRLADPLTRAFLFYLAFSLWIAATGLWSPIEGASRLSLNVLLPALAAGAVVFEAGRRPAPETRLIARCALAAVGAAAALLLFEALTGGVLRNITPPADQSEGRIRDFISLGRGATVLSTTIFAAAALAVAHFRSRLLAATLFAASFLASARLGVFTNDVALLAGALVFAAGLIAPRATLLGVGAAILVALIGAPLAASLPVETMFAGAPPGAPVSWLQRFAIWRGAALEALSCLPWGCGADYARALSEKSATIAIPGAAEPLPALPIHPHNIFLEIWLEAGVPGVLLFGAALASGLQAVLAARLPKLASAALGATAASVFVAGLVESSLWQVWRLGAVVVAALLLALAVKALREESP